MQNVLLRFAPAAALLLALTSPALATDAPVYRSGVPDVLEPESTVSRNDDAVLDQFRRLYAARKAPRIVVFWNREFSDRASDYRAVRRITEREKVNIAGNVTRPAEKTVWPTGPVTYDDFQISASRTRDRTISENISDGYDDQRLGMLESEDWSAEAAFTSLFIEAGGNLIDRAVAMRTTAARAREEGAEHLDQQQVETSALLGKADLLMEVLQTPDSDGPIGFRFRVSVKDVRTGRMLANITTVGRPAGAAETEWRATRDGFVKVARSYMAGSVGRQVGLETMRALVAVWGS